MTAHRLLLLLLGLLLLGGPVWTQDQDPDEEGSPTEATLSPSGYASLWVDKSAVVTPAAVEKTLADANALESDPEQIVVFIHGFKKPRDGSTRDFNALTQRLQPMFAKDSTQVMFVGLQWESATKASLLKMQKTYLDTVPLARSVGRGPARQLLLELQKRYPKAHVSVFAHSMGCEVAAAALLPEIRYDDQQPYVETYKPSEQVQLDMLTLAGSDLDFDFWYKSDISARKFEGRCRFTWLTVADHLERGDRVLNMRSRVRGKAAGATFPRMTLEQLDQTISERRLFLDHREIPINHKFLNYYELPRLERIVATLRYLTAPRAPEPDEIAELDEILAAPSEMEVLLPYLDRASYSAKFYALWRIERMNCGDARHMTDLTLLNVVNMLKDRPKKIWTERPKSDCVTIKKGQFPTEKLMIKAGAPSRDGPSD